ncbi:hypothetical protein V8B97DRAFT_733234 [Scleroderma yunnanense]
MFRQWARLQLRRCLHTRVCVPTKTKTSGFHSYPFYVVGASVTIATYFAWTWDSNSRRIYLDSELSSGAKPQFGMPNPSENATPSVPEPTLVSPEKAESDTASSSSPAGGNGEQEPSGSGGAFNPETGEINWDCPCLGGMAHGPCGLEFREAFSCFVYSEKEPKGIDCVEKFKAMQDCFRAHPDVYADEMNDDDDDEEGAEASSETTTQPSSNSSKLPSPQKNEGNPPHVTQS